MARVFAAAGAVLYLGLSLAAQASDSLVFGPNPELADGARALQFDDYEEGVRLTRLGLKVEQSRKERATGLSNLCAGLVGLRQYAEAIDACNQSEELRGNNWRVYNNRALAYLGLGRVERARIDLKRGLELNPGAKKLLKVEDMINERAAPLLAEAN